MTKAIKAQSLRKVYNGNPPVEALGSVDIEIEDNEFFTLLGPSGCGKTTLLRLIAGFEHPTSGRLEMFGEPLQDLPPYKRQINTVFQNYALFPHMTVAENIGFGMEMLGKPKSEIKATVDEMMDLVQMSEMADRQTSQISGGQQQRVALARALAPRPRILLLDEPLSALDFKLRKSMQLELKRLQTETGITFIFVTHDQEEALTMSDRIAVMSNGAIRQIGGPRDIYDHPADRFVADFIGDTNFLDADVVGKDGDLTALRLTSGKTITASAHDDATGRVTLAVRPEHAQLATSDEGLLTGQLREVVYFGTDTHLHVDLGDGTTFVLRQQNSPDMPANATAGSTVGITFPPAAAQVLRD
ncbi:ABC transporter ATP-binding protein [Phaeobacter sp. QD34_3]|jgi:spermidine/putrescine transport system ATP-binding protein|uniref:ABC transporter ATP-binding protein n=1 Tax=unclassified Phaeobacter TaxID=2621772 RepID=UPI00237F8960|nr:MULTISPECIES: ABC transporter ATP-binding protein [unclassified Phaeobacter]MDE4133503.1 ABC transporter ATP-binding protein [Phaeobacter sp. QD34_3]MDE4137139.1 ABC transporter ATP-binding protein [Phaeobacter sp. QD34_24]